MNGEKSNVGRGGNGMGWNGVGYIYLSKEKRK